MILFVKMQPPSDSHLSIAIRRATGSDAAALVSILEGIAAEGAFTAINKPWPANRQRRHIASMSAREAIHVAEEPHSGIVGYQVLELWAPTLDSMAHVGQIGTFLRPRWRRRGIGEALFRQSLSFARASSYLKFVIQVRASNTPAQAFYQRLGFRECGRMHRQVRIGSIEDDEIIMEYFLRAGPARSQPG